MLHVSFTLNDDRQGEISESARFYGREWIRRIQLIFLLGCQSVCPNGYHNVYYRPSLASANFIQESQNMQDLLLLRIVHNNLLTVDANGPGFSHLQWIEPFGKLQDLFVLLLQFMAMYYKLNYNLKYGVRPAHIHPQLKLWAAGEFFTHSDFAIADFGSAYDTCSNCLDWLHLDRQSSVKVRQRVSIG